MRIKHSAIRIFIWATTVALSMLSALPATRALGQAIPAFCVTLSPQYGPFGYQKRDDNRCEGLLNPTVDAIPIELLSLTVQSQLPPPSTTVVEVGIPFKMPASGVHLVGISLVPDIDYRLDVNMTNSRPKFEYHLSEIVSQVGLDLSQIGLVARVSDTVWPVYIGMLNGSATTPARANFTVRLSMLATRVSWKWDTKADSAHIETYPA